jgi:hypothetical protein
MDKEGMETRQPPKTCRKSKDFLPLVICLSYEPSELTAGESRLLSAILAEPAFPDAQGLCVVIEQRCIRVDLPFDRVR